jgi:hypothetical protein
MSSPSSSIPDGYELVKLPARVPQTVASARLPSPPSLASLKAALTALPSGASGSGGNRRGSKRRLASNVGRYFNMLAGRPIPRLVGSVQTIKVSLMEDFGQVFVTSTTVPMYYGVSFSASNISSSNLLSVFDQYRIDRIEVWFEPQAAQGSTQFSMLGTCVDLDDASAPASMNVLSHHPLALVGSGGTGRYHAFEPHVAVAAYSGAFTSFSNEPPQWIDSASPNVAHYGFKVAADATLAAISYIMTVRFTMSFRAPGIA